MIEKIKRLAREFYDEVVRHRRHIHQHPELSFEEEKTAKYIAEVLESEGLIVQRNIGGHGMVVVIEGAHPKNKTVALRADMDALPIEEESDVPYRSVVQGTMHACGHDVHSSSLIGTALILHRLKDQMQGRVKLIFQPAEEKLPGGASLMIKDGVLEDPKPVSIFAQHVHPPLEVGKVGIKGGMYMASTDELYLTVHGKGGHAAMPQDAIDPIVIASNIVIALQQLVSRASSPTIPSVVTLGKISSEGGATNVIPSTVKLEGTFRTMNEKWRSEAHFRMRQIVEHTANAHGGRATLEIKNGYPFLSNNDALSARFKQYAIEYLGAQNVVDLPIRMTGEDFAYFSQEIDACFYRLGTGNAAEGINAPVHTPTFNVDESCLEHSIGLMAYCALKELENQ